MVDASIVARDSKIGSSGDRVIGSSVFSENPEPEPGEGEGSIPPQALSPMSHFFSKVFLWRYGSLSGFAGSRFQRKIDGPMADLPITRSCSPSVSIKELSLWTLPG